MQLFALWKGNECPYSMTWEISSSMIPSQVSDVIVRWQSGSFPFQSSDLAGYYGICFPTICLNALASVLSVSREISIFPLNGPFDILESPIRWRGLAYWNFPISIALKNIESYLIYNSRLSLIRHRSFPRIASRCFLKKNEPQSELHIPHIRRNS